MVTHNGDSLDDAVKQSLEALYHAPSPTYINDLLCSPESCPNVACWKLVWMEGACEHLPASICHTGRIFVEEIMENFERYVCNVCEQPLVPAGILPLYSKGRFLET